ncbi:hypothetical protein AB836_01945 [Rickettsiales bacterium (ex Bugula neritina AB1)]|nr:hypothetical protein AB836_01945 [Rickettsiales bacterium (ex Bugula neritina AB1)]
MQNKNKLKSMSRTLKREIVRRVFARKEWSLQELPGVLDFQLDSFKKFIDKELNNKISLHNLFKESFPIVDLNNRIKIEYIDYKLQDSIFSPQECRNRGATYVKKIFLKLRIIGEVSSSPMKNNNEELDEEENNITSEKNSSTKQVFKEDWFYTGNLPLMTDTCNFIINGNEKYVVSQLKRCPGPFFCKGIDVTSNTHDYFIKLIPLIGSWIEFIIDKNDTIVVKIDKKKKILFSTFLMCFENPEDTNASLFDKESILSNFYKNCSLKFTDDYEYLKLPNKLEFFLGKSFNCDIWNSTKKKILFPAKVIISEEEFYKNEKDSFVAPISILKDCISASYIVNNTTGEIYTEAGDSFSEKVIIDKVFKTEKIKEVSILLIGNQREDMFVLNTIQKDNHCNRPEALNNWGRVFKYSEYLNFDGLVKYFKDNYESNKFYDLSKIGRYRLNQKILSIKKYKNIFGDFDDCEESSSTFLRTQDIIRMVQSLILLYKGYFKEDDMDDYTNRRVRPVGELFNYCIKIGIDKLKKKFNSKYIILTEENLKNLDFFNIRSILYTLLDFLNTSQLCQFADQNNPLSKISHSRKLSNFGPGGILKDRVPDSLRSISHTQIGRVCAIETPEGQKIGLVTFLSSHAKIDDNGFLMAPYYSVKNGIADTSKVVYLTAFEEEEKVIAEKIFFHYDKNHQLVIKDNDIYARKGNVYTYFSKDQINFVEVSPLQFVSLSVALIVFLSHNDSYRILMSGNMAKQALPLLVGKAPNIATGFEKKIAESSKEIITAHTAGVVRMVDSRRIVVESLDPISQLPKIDIYELSKYTRTNQDTCSNQKPIVQIGDNISVGSILADGYGTYKGELALGNDFTVLYRSCADCFEDAILVNSSTIENDSFTSINVIELECIAKDTRFGVEEISRDLQYFGNTDLSHLDEFGIVTVGTNVRPGMILVGKITPRSEGNTDLQHKLLQVIFADKSSNYKDTSLRVPPAIYGTVTRVEIFTRSGVEFDGSALTVLKNKIDFEVKKLNNTIYILMDFLREKVFSLLKNNEIQESIGGIEKKQKITDNHFSKFKLLQLEQLFRIKILDKSLQSRIIKIIEEIEKQIKEQKTEHKKTLEAIKTEYKFPDESTTKIIKVYISHKNTIESGNKLCSRYGNKGVVSRVLNKVDMPYLEDGTIIDIVFNPLGILARMNLGQIFETTMNLCLEKIRKNISNKLKKFLKNNSDENLQQLQDAMIDGIGEEDVNKFFMNTNEYISIFQLNINEIIALATKLSEGIFCLMPPFESISFEEIKNLLKKYELPEDGKLPVYDGQTGELIKNTLLVGRQFVLKLTHVVVSKMHARSIGPYLEQTQQPSCGKKKTGGQKIGEMENWSIAAHGAAHILYENNVKSDNIKKRQEYFRKLSSQGIVLTTSEYIKKEIKNYFINSDTEEYKYTEPCFDVVKEMFYACGFKVVNSWVRESNIIGEKPLDFTSLVDILDNQEEVDELVVEEIDAKNKMLYYVNNKIPSYRRSIKFVLLNPNDILKSCHGEVKKTETINYRSNNPEIGGLFCPQIFGPHVSYQCLCGRYNQSRYVNLKCEKCGVTVLHETERRKRRGYVKLNHEIFHPFYLKPNNNKICILLDINFTELKQLKNLESYIVFDGKDTKYKYLDIISRDEYLELKKSHNITAKTGAKAVKEIFESMNLEIEQEKIQEQINNISSQTSKDTLYKKLSLIKTMIHNKIRPEWMILEYLVILPCGLRKFVEIAPNEYACPDINTLYKEIIGKNNRLKIFQEIEATIAIHDNEVRMLQTAIEELFNKHEKYKSLLDFLQGKYGLLRQNLLGKRVDYSGRSVIVVAPNAGIDECYIPREMLIVLLKPHMHFMLQKRGITSNWNEAQKILEDIQNPKIWDILIDLVEEYVPYYILNRAPSLHKLSMLAFKIKVWDKRTIGLNPLVCKGFNADFDGDQMAIHVPLSIEAQLEAKELMIASKNIYSNTNGDLMILPSQDISFGLYLLTKNNEKIKSNFVKFFNIWEIHHALNKKIIDIQDTILFYYEQKFIETTAGRVILWQYIPKHPKIKFSFINKNITNKFVQEILKLVRRYVSDKATLQLACDIKDLGFKYVEYFGVSFSIEDFVELEEINTIKNEGDHKQKEYDDYYKAGLMDEKTREKKITEHWLQLSQTSKEHLLKIVNNNSNNPVFASINSGARGSIIQLLQIVAFKGFVTKLDGSLSSFPITRNYKEGLFGYQVFASSTGAIVSGSTISIKTSTAGYFTRKLIEISHAVTVTNHDCNTKESLEVKNKISSGGIISTIYEQILGRVIAEDLINPNNNELLIKRNHLVTDDDIDLLQSIGIVSCKIRSPTLCKSRTGVCRLCYGTDLSTNNLVNEGTAVGIIASQSIGEPGTQLTMHAKHFGGVSQKELMTTKIYASFNGVLEFVRIKTVKIDKENVVFSRGGKIRILNNLNVQVAEYSIPYGTTLKHKNNNKITKGELIAEWDIFQPIFAEVEGICRYQNLIDKITYDVIYDEVSGITEKIVRLGENRKYTIIPALVIYDKSGKEVNKYILEENTVIEVEDGEEVSETTRIAKVQNKIYDNVSITEGLPKVICLFENRSPSINALIASHSGTVDIIKNNKNRTIIKITNNKTDEVSEYTLGKHNRTIVQNREEVDKGDILTTGTPLLNDMLNVKGLKGFIEYFINEVNGIYNAHGIKINYKHFEIILSKLISKVEIIDTGDSNIFTKGDIADIGDVEEMNLSLNNPIKYKHVFMGLTNMALKNKSLLASVSFQETTRVMANSLSTYVMGSTVGFKEDLMLGKIPNLGTGAVVKKIFDIVVENLNKLK